jgi:hypothetical protein
MNGSSLAVQLIAFYPQSVRAIKLKDDPGRSNGEKMKNPAASSGVSEGIDQLIAASCGELTL